MSKPDTLSTLEFFQKFPNEESARQFFESCRWNGEAVCGHCGSISVSECKDHKPMAYRCKDCRKHFSVRTGTVLAESRLPLQKWLLAIFILTNARKGIPATQMARELGITQKSAWFLAQRIRETWLGKGGGTDMGNHVQVRAKPVANTNAATLKGFIRSNAPAGATVVTDGFNSYDGLTAECFKHKTVNHTIGEYVRNGSHTNGIESFWALLKRGHYGVYHYMSAKHLHRYVDEFAFRHNTSQAGTLQFIGMTISRMAQKRLTYKELISA